METKDFFEIVITGNEPNQDFGKGSVEVAEIQGILEAAHLLYKHAHKDGKLYYSMEEGSIRNVFYGTLTGIMALNNTLGIINRGGYAGSIETVEYKAMEILSKIATNTKLNLEIKTSVADSNRLTITSATKIEKAAPAYYDTEMYLYGCITSIGGKTNPNIHLDSDEYGTVIIEASREVLSGLPSNILYKHFGIRVTLKRDFKTNDIEKSSIKFIELVNYEPSFTVEDVLKNSHLQNFNVSDVDNYIREMRGYTS